MVRYSVPRSWNYSGEAVYGTWSFFLLHEDGALYDDKY